MLRRKTIRALRVEQRDDSLGLAAATRRNLELDTSLSGNETATLFAVLDGSVTPMGSRALRRWLNRPLRAQPVLRERYHAIGALGDARGYEPLREQLRGVGDLERILARIALRSARPRDQPFSLSASAALFSDARRTATALLTPS